MERYLAAALLGVFIMSSVPAAAQPPGNQLPPGLQKKVERGEPLPPGWQKKVNYREGDFLDRDLLRYGTIEDIDGNRQRVRIEDRVYTVVRDTREILDILSQ
ncbi:hypothetical protein [Marinobacter sp.]|uniref:hypothetical protein n=1 Tax=Marinobacter sp. TaxID=50741 RepID=UPI003A94CEBF